MKTKGDKGDSTVTSIRIHFVLFFFFRFRGSIGVLLLFIWFLLFAQMLLLLNESLVE